MAASPKRIRRKDLRAPDQFVTLTGQLFDFVRQYRLQVLTAAVLVVVLGLGLWGWGLYRNQQSQLAAQEYSRALTRYHGGQYKLALAGFAQVQSYGSTPYRALAKLYQAKSYIAMNDGDKARALLQAFLQEEWEKPTLREIAYLTLAYSQERSGRPKEASASFAEAAKIKGPFGAEALLGQARSSAQAGDVKGALSASRQYLTDYPGSERTTEVQLEIQRLEGSVQDGKAGKAK